MAKKIDLDFIPNDRIQTALDNFMAGDRNNVSEDELDQLMMAISASIVDSTMRGEELLAPAVPADENGTPLQLEYMSDDQIQQYLESDSQGLAVVGISSGEDDEWLPVFTTIEDVQAGEATDVMGHQIDTLLEMTVDMGFDGIVFNPWTDSINVPISTVKLLVDTIHDIHNSEGEEELEGDINLVLGDITGVVGDAIVNSANNMLLPDFVNEGEEPGINQSIHEAAGPELEEACRKLRGCRTSEAKITEGFGLDVNYIIHTVGPIYDGARKCEEELADCYWNVLNLAIDYDIHTIAFPAISAGHFGFPIEKAAQIAVETVVSWMDAYAEDYQMQITFCIDNEEECRVYEAFLDKEIPQDDEPPMNPIN